ncbi:MAG: 3-deoxy-manno-octulosonate cytidylyltransferase [Candidatus Firestonebacteria bacterium]
MKKEMKVIGVIPARFASERFPGKVLVNISGKPMIWWVWNSARKSKILEEIFVATDDIKIYDLVRSFGGKAIITNKSHESGTDRIAEAVKKIKADIVVNIQGDEPLIKPEMIDEAVSPFFEDKNIYMSTLICKIQDKKILFDDNMVKVAIDKNGYVLYFSRSIIPSLVRTNKFDFFYKHIGVYVYKKDFLLKFVGLKQSRLENIEKLEQLRVLENGYKIKAVITPYDTIPVDTLNDLKKVIRFLNIRTLAEDR